MKPVKLSTLKKGEKFQIPGNEKMVYMITTTALPNFYCVCIEGGGIGGFWPATTDVIPVIETDLRQTAMKWWNDLGSTGKQGVTYIYFKGRQWDTLTGREIESIYMEELGSGHIKEKKISSEDIFNQVQKLPMPKKDDKEGKGGKEKEAGNE